MISFRASRIFSFSSGVALSASKYANSLALSKISSCTSASEFGSDSLLTANAGTARAINIISVMVMDKNFFMKIRSVHIHPIDFRFCCQGLSFHSTSVSPPIRSVYNKVEYCLAFNTYSKGMYPLGSAYADPISLFFMDRLL